MSAQELLDAATLLRVLAKDAGGPLNFPTPWEARDSQGDEIDHVGIASLIVCDNGEGDVTDWIDPACAHYIAALDPTVGLLLADWLEREAQKRPSMTFGGGSTGGPATEAVDIAKLINASEP